MSTIVFTPLSPAMPPEPIARLTVEQFHRMVDAGLFTDDDPVELLEGWLVYKMPKKSPHRVATGLTGDALLGVLPTGWHVCTQEPITTDDSEPEPDAYVARGKRRDHTDEHPRPKDVPLLVEISDSTLARDRGFKKRIYARASIPVFWIVNLIDRCIEVYTDPTGPCDLPDYGRKEVFGVDESVLVILDGQEIGRIEVKQIIP